MILPNTRYRFISAFIATLAITTMLSTPVSASSESKNATDGACLIKYNSLSPVICEPTSGDMLTSLARITSEKGTATDEATLQDKQKKDRLGIREVEGVNKEYLYTDRVARGRTMYYTMLREHPDEDSERISPIVNGDKVRVMKLDQTEEWYFVEIFKSHDEELIGDEGWIETWLIDNEEVPVKPTAMPTPTQSPEVKGAESNAGDSQSNQPSPAVAGGQSAELYSRVNDYRVQNGMPPFQTSERLCAIANQRAPEIAGEVATGTIHAGFYSRGYGYPDIENAVGMGSVDANFNWWISSSLHRGSILGPDLTYSCLACSGGNCVQIFSSQP
ncbi:MAG: CAP domain-containing protein [Patescibacteria group bacterium]